jgi:C4-dicarboxylate-binding protein DctP
VALRLQSLLAWLVMLLAGTALPAAAEALVFRISTENTPAHFQTRVVQRFADTLAGRTRGRLRVEFHHSAQLFRDQDVVRALNDGKVEMAVPGNWQLDRYDPYVSVLTLPMLMGRSAAEHHQFRDGKTGLLISAHLAQSLQVVVPGRWIDLGYANLFTTHKPVALHTDMAGLRIRIAGGTAIASQVTAVGAIPAVVSWPDLPGVLQQGQLDGLLSTYETMASARLWEAGLRHATESRAYFAQYIPLVARGYWYGLPDDLRQAIRESWESVVDGARAEAESTQQEARRMLQAHGVQVQELSPPALLAWRRQITREQAALARQLGIPAALLEATVQQFGANP